MSKLQIYREQIDKIDKKIIDLFGKRFLIVGKIGKDKKKNNLPVLDKKRESEKIEELSKFARKYSLPKSFIRNVWNKIFKQSYEIEK